MGISPSEAGSDSHVIDVFESPLKPGQSTLEVYWPLIAVTLISLYCITSFPFISPIIFLTQYFMLRSIKQTVKQQLKPIVTLPVNLTVEQPIKFKLNLSTILEEPEEEEENSSIDLTLVRPASLAIPDEETGSITMIDGPIKQSHSPSKSPSQSMLAATAALFSPTMLQSLIQSIDEKSRFQFDAESDYVIDIDALMSQSLTQPLTQQVVQCV